MNVVVKQNLGWCPGMKSNRRHEEVSVLPVSTGNQLLTPRLLKSKHFTTRGCFAHPRLPHDLDTVHHSTDPEADNRTRGEDKSTLQLRFDDVRSGKPSAYNVGAHAFADFLVPAMPG
jgi:hypothetical protein